MKTPRRWTDRLGRAGPVVGTIARIPRDYLVKGVPIKKIARDLRVAVS